MAKEIIWTKRADKQFDEILDYLSKEWGNKTITKFIIKVYSINSASRNRND